MGDFFAKFMNPVRFVIDENQSSSSSSSSFYLPSNTTVCTSTSIQLRTAGQQGPTRTLTAALQHSIKQLLGIYSKTLSRRLGYCSPDTSTFDELCDTADDELFSRAVQLSNHVLYALLPTPPTASQRYNHADTVRTPYSCLNIQHNYPARNFLTRTLYKNTY